jgi:hypothetical protein
MPLKHSSEPRKQLHSNSRHPPRSSRTLRLILGPVDCDVGGLGRLLVAICVIQGLPLCWRTFRRQVIEKVAFQGRRVSMVDISPSVCWGSQILCALRIKVNHSLIISRVTKFALLLFHASPAICLSRKASEGPTTGWTCRHTRSQPQSIPKSLACHCCFAA